MKSYFKLQPNGGRWNNTSNLIGVMKSCLYSLPRCAHGSCKCTKIFRGFAHYVCWLKIVQHIGGLRPTICLLFLQKMPNKKFSVHLILALGDCQKFHLFASPVYFCFSLSVLNFMGFHGDISLVNFLNYLFQIGHIVILLSHHFAEYVSGNGFFAPTTVPTHPTVSLHLLYLFSQLHSSNFIKRNA